MGKSSINGPFSMAMLNNQRVISFRRRCCQICFTLPRIYGGDFQLFLSSAKVYSMAHKKMLPSGNPTWKERDFQLCCARCHHFKTAMAGSHKKNNPFYWVTGFVCFCSAISGSWILYILHTLPMKHIPPWPCVF